MFLCCVTIGEGDVGCFYFKYFIIILVLFHSIASDRSFHNRSISWFLCCSLYIDSSFPFCDQYFIYRLDCNVFYLIFHCGNRLFKFKFN